MLGLAQDDNLKKGVGRLAVPLAISGGAKKDETAEHRQKSCNGTNPPRTTIM